MGEAFVNWITALHLKSWADAVDSRATLSELASSLIRASVSKITSIRFPTGDSAQMPGYDGRLVCSEGSLYVPEGESVWEFGTDLDYLNKANDDYRSRSEKPGAINTKDNTFVFVTPDRGRAKRKHERTG